MDELVRSESGLLRPPLNKKLSKHMQWNKTLFAHVIKICNICQSLLSLEYRVPIVIRRVKVVIRAIQK